jgi:hypothetical protein
MSFSFDLHSLVSRYIPSSIRRERQAPDTDSAGIPFSNQDDIDALRRDYEEKTRSAQDPTLESCFKCVVCHASITATASNIVNVSSSRCCRRPR